MIQILKKSYETGIVTDKQQISENFRGRPQIAFDRWTDARPSAAVCPTGAITIDQRPLRRTVSLDYGRCTFCGECAEASPEAIEITTDFHLATTRRQDLVTIAEYALEADGTHGQLLGLHSTSADTLGLELASRAQSILGRSLAIRQVDAGSCNGCELEITALNNPVYDIERFGIRFVASPRHADMLMVTGPVTRAMEAALLKTYRATPEPRIVVAVGACGCSGGIFGVNYATRGGVDQVIPVDVYIPGCPPRPEALLNGLLLALGRLQR
jgi:Ni,Fe-hydrogenase III small subunit/ferredoxin